MEALEDAHDEGHTTHAELIAGLEPRASSSSSSSATPKEGRESGGGQRSGLHIICTAVLHDDLLRQVRLLALPHLLLRPRIWWGRGLGQE